MEPGLAPTHYDTLGVSPRARPEVVRAAYLALAKLHHPDGPTPDEELMKQVNLAWDVLQAPDERAAYDAELARRASVASSGASAASAGPRPEDDPTDNHGPGAGPQTGRRSDTAGRTDGWNGWGGAGAGQDGWADEPRPRGDGWRNEPPGGRDGWGDEPPHGRDGWGEASQGRSGWGETAGENGTSTGPDVDGPYGRTDQRYPGATPQGEMVDDDPWQPAPDGWWPPDPRHAGQPDGPWDVEAPEPTAVMLRRFAAYVVDLLIVLLPGSVLVRYGGSPVRPAVTIAVVTFVWMHVIGEGQTGRTPGKTLFRVRTVQQSGQPPGVGRALVRSLLWPVDSFPWVVPLVAAHVARRSGGHRRIGDLAARTFVVRAEDAGWPLVPAAPGDAISDLG